MKMRFGHDLSTPRNVRAHGAVATAVSPFSYACLWLAAICTLFILLEPTISRGASTSTQFTVSQTVSNEIAIQTPPSNVTLSPSLGGLTGGTATGVTQIVINSGSITGYSITLQASSSLGMIGNASSTNYIPAYTPTTPSVPDYNFNTPANAARFGYTVDASTTSDLAPAFLSNGSNACNTGSTDPGLAHCWINASTTAVTIVNRSLSTPAGGATTTLKFQVTINSNPSPTIPNDTYVATTTLTAFTN